MRHDATLTFEFILDPAETVRATRAVRRRQGFAWMAWANWAAAAVMGALYFLLPVDLRSLWLVGIAAFVLAGLVEPGTTWVLRRHYRHVYRESPDLRGVQVYRFSAAGLTITGGATTVTFGWDSFIDAAETTEFFLFYYSKRAAHYLPKRAMSDDVQDRRLRDLIVAGMGDRASGLRND
jgi:hypothetical protein